VRSSASTQAGFSLIELLVIVLLIGILAAIALTSLLGQDAKAQDADAKQTARTLQTAMRICGIDQGGSFTNPRACNLRRLREIEPSLAGGGVNANPSSPSGGFTVRASSDSGNTFTVTRYADGDVERTCKVKDKDTTGGCNLTKGKNGEW
jgi:type IV pilus assembly protein PilA